MKQLASMGPRSGDRGDCCNYFYEGVLDGVLQWGRGPETAETAPWILSQNPGC